MEPNVFFEDENNQEKIRQLLNRINAPEQQIQEFFVTGNLRLSESQKNEVCEIVNELIWDKIDSEDDIKIFKIVFILMMSLGRGNLDSLFSKLNGLLDIHAE